MRGLPFDTWEDVVAYVRDFSTLYYRAPMDYKSTLVEAEREVGMRAFMSDQTERYMRSVKPLSWAESEARAILRESEPAWSVHAERVQLGHHANGALLNVSGYADFKYALAESLAAFIALEIS